jgi:hypothetical protein
MSQVLNVLTRRVHIGCDPKLTKEKFEEMVRMKDAQYKCVICEPVRREQLMSDRFQKVVSYNGLPLVAPPLILKTK